MKKVVQVTEVEDEGLIALLNKNVVVFCANYIYSGKLTGVNQTCVLLENAQIVFDTGEVSFKKFTTAEEFLKPIYIQLNAIEMFTERP